MKTHLILAATLAASLTAVHAQEGVPALPASPPAAESATGEPAQAAPTPASGLDEPLSLIPATPPAAPVSSGSEAPMPAAAPGSEAAAPAKLSKPAPLKKGTAEELRQAIHIRELKTEVQKDKAVQAQYTQATHARTNAGRRVALRNYYTLLNAGIVKLDPALKEPMEQKLADQLRILEQHRVRPTLLIEPIAELPGSHSADHQKAAPASGSATAAKKGKPDSNPAPDTDEEETSDPLAN